MVFSSPSVLLLNQPVGSKPADSSLSEQSVASPLLHWWVQVFQQQAKLEQALTHKLAIKLPQSQEVQVQTSLQNALVTLRLQLQEAFQGFQVETNAVAWMESPQRDTVLALITQQAHWAIRLEALLPEAKTKVAEMQQFSFIETVVPRVLLQPQTVVRMLNNQSQTSTPALSLVGITLLEERISWIKAMSPLAWGDLIQGSLSAVAEQYIGTLSSLPPLSQNNLSAVLGVLLLGESYYYYWATTALSTQALMKTSNFWETEAVLFEALQFFQTKSTLTTSWHQQLQALKPVNVQPKVQDSSAWFGALQTAIPAKLHATVQQAKRANKLQSKLKAGRFISAICEEDMHQLWETLNDATQPIDIYACLQQITETPCDMKEMVTAVWLYQLQSQVPEWLAWLENPTDAGSGWQGLTHQLIQHETSVLKSIETALLHKTVLGEEV